MAEVFLSYAREDQARAAQVARGLEAIGLDTFWDTEIPPGQTWADYIEAKLSDCKVVIVLWSEHSTRSQWVREEARMGRDQAKLIPVMLDHSPAPFGFGEVQAANLAGWRGEANNPDWQRFSRAVFAAARGPGAALPQPAPQAAYAPPPRAQPSAVAESAETLSPWGYVQKCFRLFIDGKGRARRSEYWWWTLFALIVYLVAYMLDIALFGFNTYTSAPNQQVLYVVAALALLAPTLSVMSRRFHDVGLSGWLVGAAIAIYAIGAAMLASFLPAGSILVFVVAVAVLVVALIPSRPGPNRYGPNPKGI